MNDDENGSYERKYLEIHSCTEGGSRNLERSLWCSVITRGLVRYVFDVNSGGWNMKNRV